MYAFTRKSGHNVWKEQWYAFASRVLSRADFYLTHEDQVFVTNVVVMDLTLEMVAMSVISQPTSATVELSTIAKIRKYKGIHEGHHFILIAMEVHNAPKRDMDCFIREYAHLFHNR
jgi:hypothetical protein